MKIMQLGRALVATLIMTSSITIGSSITVLAENDKQLVQPTGQVYELEGDEKYSFTEKEAIDTNDENTYGMLTLSGALKEDGTHEGITSYASKGGNPIAFSYIYDDKLAKAAKEEWHLSSDGSDAIDGVDLKGDIENGAIVLQASPDGKRWVTVFEEENAFSNSETRETPFYETSDLELLNGYYYKVFVAYKLSKYDGHELTGIVKSPRVNVVSATQKELASNSAVPKDFYVIEKTGVESIVIWQREDGTVFYSEPDTEPVEYCKSLSEYIEKY